MYIQGVSTRKVKAITDELCGHRVSASTISRINQRLNKTLTAFAERRLDEPMPYLILDARYEKVREGGVIRSQAVLIAIGINRDGRRQILGVEMANRDWVVYAKPPFNGPGQVMACFGRYTHKTVIANHRLVASTASGSGSAGVTTPAVTGAGS